MTPALTAAIGACRASMAARADRSPDPDLADAVIAALGPYGRVLDAEETTLVVALRPELRGPLVAPVEARFIAPAKLVRRRLDRLIELDAPEIILEQERATLAGLEGAPFVPDVSEVSTHPDLDRFPGNLRRLHVALACAELVAPWLGAYPAHPLLDDARRILRDHRVGLPSLRDVRGVLEAMTYGDGAPVVPTIVLRAVVLAHDLATETEARVEQNEPHDLARWAIEKHEAPDDPSGVAALNERLFTWWLDDAIPAALLSTAP